MKNVFHLLGVQKLRTSQYHPQTDGQVERFNRTLKRILTAFVNDDQNDWDLHLPLALFAYRTSMHRSSGVTPFKAVHGREAASPLSLMSAANKRTEGLVGNYCDELEKTIHDIHKQVATNVRGAQNRQKQAYDKQTKVESGPLKAGDQVWLNNKAVPKGKSRKFHNNWTGPYEVLSRLGAVNYRIKRAIGRGGTMHSCTS